MNGSFTPYVPDYLAACLDDPRRLIPPYDFSFPGAVLLLDISGFTALTERLGGRGAAGAEQISHLLDDYFGRLIDLTLDHGGDVAQFTGDGLLAVWPAAPGGPESQAESALREATRLAAQCGLAIQRTLRDFRAGDGSPLAVRVSIGAGDCVSRVLGGVGGRCEYALAGEAVIQASVLNRIALPGQVVLGAQAHALVRSEVLGLPVTIAQAPAGTFRLAGLRELLPLAPRPPRALADHRLGPLRGFVPAPVLTRAEDDAEAQWMAEVRQLSLLFLRVTQVDHTTPLGSVQSLFEALQTVYISYEAPFSKVSFDDHGMTLMLAFGVPPASHEDDGARAVRAALALLQRLQEEGWKGVAGVATGRSFCGLIGNDRRRDYSINGSAANRAARLMQNAHDSVLCDHATFQAASGQVSFESLPAVVLRGVSEPVPVYRPRQRREQTEEEEEPATQLIGRTNERQVLRGALQRLQAGEGGAVVVEGAPGIGKSRLLGEVMREGRERRVNVLAGQGDAVEHQRLYHGWRGVFERLLRPVASIAADPVAERATALLPPESRLVGLEPLLNDILGTTLPETEITAALIGQARAEATHALLCELLRRAAALQPTLVVLEDVHWLDSASWSLVTAVSRDVPAVLLLLTTRPVAEPNPAFAQLLGSPRCTHLRLRVLNAEDSLALARQRLGVLSLPPAVNELLRSRAAGNPFFVEELAGSLRDEGLLRIVDGECVLNCTPEQLRAMRFPDTVQGIVTSRIDRLKPEEQLTLKVASVIGRSFAYPVLQHVYPLVSKREQLPAHLSVLEALDITSLQSPQPHLRYLFKHIITQEVAYHLMLFAQRRQLHAAVAQWYEQALADDLSPYYPLLARHWVRADQCPQAIFYLEKAGEQAARSYANREAESFFREALELLPRLPEGVERLSQELSLCLSIGPVLLVTEGQTSVRAKAAYDRAWELCGQLDDTPRLAGILFGLWAFYLFHAELLPAQQVAEQCLALAETLGDPDLELQAHLALGNTLYWVGDLEGSLQHVDHVLRLHDPSHHEQYLARYAQDPRFTCMTFGCQAMWASGRPDTALFQAREALRLAKELAHPYSVVLALQSLAMVHLLRGEVAPAREAATSLVALAEKHVFPPYLVLGKIVWAWALARDGSPEAAIPLLREGLDTWEMMGLFLVQTFYLSVLAEAYLLAGRHAEAQATVNEALRLACETHELTFEPALHRLNGLLSLATAPHEEAEAARHFTLAVESARRCSARTQEVLALTQLAGLTLENNTAGTLLQELLATLSEGENTAAIRRAQERIARSPLA